MLKMAAVSENSKRIHYPFQKNVTNNINPKIKLKVCCPIMHKHDKEIKTHTHTHNNMPTKKIPSLKC